MLSQLVSEEEQLLLANAQSVLNLHQSTCMAQAPVLAQEVDHISHDLHILSSLKTRIDQVCIDRIFSYRDSC